MATYDLETKEAMGEKDDDGGGTDLKGLHAYIPVGDGRSDTLREFRKAVNWWLHGAGLGEDDEVQPSSSLCYVICVAERQCQDEGAGVRR